MVIYKNKEYKRVNGEWVDDKYVKVPKALEIELDALYSRRTMSSRDKKKGRMAQNKEWKKYEKSGVKIGKKTDIYNRCYRIPGDWWRR